MMVHQGIDTVIEELRVIVGADRVLADPYSLGLYSYDGGTDAAAGDAVVIPEDRAQLAAVVAIAARHGVALIPRGGGTGLSGGSIPCEGGITLSFARLRHVLAVYPEHLAAHVEAGVVNLNLGRAVAGYGLQFAPDPSSQAASTIGGNVAMNAGGPHTLAYGVTANHILGLRLILADGERVEIGGLAPDEPGYDLASLVVGSEETLGIVADVLVRLVPQPEAVRTLVAVFDAVERCAACVGAIITSGDIPAALEMMDNAALRAIEAAVHADYPLDASAVLLIEIDGLTEAVDATLNRVRETCMAEGAVEVRVARDEQERARLWKARKEVGGALGRLAPNYYVMDGVVPRSALPAVLAAVDEIAARHDLRAATVLHAGDGNLHPNLLFDSDEPGVIARPRGGGRDPGSLRGARGLAYRRTRHRRGEAGPRASHVLRR
jgi:glycolate oxidase